MTRPHPDDLAAVLATVLPRLHAIAETVSATLTVINAPAASMPDIPQPRKDKL